VLDNLIAVFTIIGFVMVSLGKPNMQKWGFVLMAFAQSGWIWIGIVQNLPQLIWVNIFFCFFSVIGAYKRFTV
jgi:hypothetical protein